MLSPPDQIIINCGPFRSRSQTHWHPHMLTPQRDRQEQRLKWQQSGSLQSMQFWSSLQSCIFQPLAFENLGTMNELCCDFICDLGNNIFSVTGKCLENQVSYPTNFCHNPAFQCHFIERKLSYWHRQTRLTAIPAVFRSAFNPPDLYYRG